MEPPIDQEMVEILQKFPSFLQWSMDNENVIGFFGNPDEDDWVKIIQEYHNLTGDTWTGGFAVPGGMVDFLVMYPPGNKDNKTTRYFLCDDNRYYLDQADKLKPKISVPLRHARGNGEDVLILTEYVNQD